MSINQAGSPHVGDFESFKNQLKSIATPHWGRVLYANQGSFKEVNYLTSIIDKIKAIFFGEVSHTGQEYVECNVIKFLQDGFRQGTSDAETKELARNLAKRIGLNPENKSKHEDLDHLIDLINNDQPIDEDLAQSFYDKLERQSPTPLKFKIQKAAESILFTPLKEEDIFLSSKQNRRSLDEDQCEEDNPNGEDSDAQMNNGSFDAAPQEQQQHQADTSLFHSPIEDNSLINEVEGVENFSEVASELPDIEESEEIDHVQEGAIEADNPSSKGRLITTAAILIGLFAAFQAARPLGTYFLGDLSTTDQTSNNGSSVADVLGQRVTPLSPGDNLPITNPPVIPNAMSAQTDSIEDVTPKKILENAPSDAPKSEDRVIRTPADDETKPRFSDRVQLWISSQGINDILIGGGLVFAGGLAIQQSFEYRKRLKDQQQINESVRKINAALDDTTTLPEQKNKQLKEIFNDVKTEHLLSIVYNIKDYYKYDVRKEMFYYVLDKKPFGDKEKVFLAQLLDHSRWSLQTQACGYKKLLPDFINEISDECITSHSEQLTAYLEMLHRVETTMRETHHKANGSRVSSIQRTPENQRAKANEDQKPLDYEFDTAIFDLAQRVQKNADRSENSNSSVKQRIDNLISKNPINISNNFTWDQPGIICNIARYIQTYSEREVDAFYQRCIENDRSRKTDQTQKLFEAIKTLPKDLQASERGSLFSLILADIAIWKSLENGDQKNKQAFPDSENRIKQTLISVKNSFVDKRDFITFLKERFPSSPLIIKPLIIKAIEELSVGDELLGHFHEELKSLESPKVTQYNPPAAPIEGSGKEEVDEKQKSEEQKQPPNNVVGPENPAPQPLQAQENLLASLQKKFTNITELVTDSYFGQLVLPQDFESKKRQVKKSVENILSLFANDRKANYEKRIAIYERLNQIHVDRSSGLVWALYDIKGEHSFLIRQELFYYFFNKQTFGKNDIEFLNSLISRENWNYHIQKKQEQNIYKFIDSIPNDWIESKKRNLISFLTHSINTYSRVAIAPAGILFKLALRVNEPSQSSLRDMITQNPGKALSYIINDPNRSGRKTRIYLICDYFIVYSEDDVNKLYQSLMDNDFSDNIKLLLDSIQKLKELDSIKAEKAKSALLAQFMTSDVSNDKAKIKEFFAIWTANVGSEENVIKFLQEQMTHEFIRKNPEIIPRLSETLNELYPENELVRTIQDRFETVRNQPPIIEEPPVEPTKVPGIEGLDTKKEELPKSSIGSTLGVQRETVKEEASPIASELLKEKEGEVEIKETTDSTRIEQVHEKSLKELLKDISNEKERVSSAEKYFEELSIEKLPSQLTELPNQLKGIYSDFRKQERINLENAIFAICEDKILNNKEANPETFYPLLGALSSRYTKQQSLSDDDIAKIEKTLALLSNKDSPRWQEFIQVLINLPPNDEYNAKAFEAFEQIKTLNQLPTLWENLSNSYEKNRNQLTLDLLKKTLDTFVEAKKFSEIESIANEMLAASPFSNSRQIIAANTITHLAKHHFDQGIVLFKDFLKALKNQASNKSAYFFLPSEVEAFIYAFCLKIREEKRSSDQDEIVKLLEVENGKQVLKLHLPFEKKTSFWSWFSPSEAPALRPLEGHIDNQKMNEFIIAFKATYEPILELNIALQHRQEILKKYFDEYFLDFTTKIDKETRQQLAVAFFDYFLQEGKPAEKCKENILIFLSQWRLDDSEAPIDFLNTYFTDAKLRDHRMQIDALLNGPTPLPGIFIEIFAGLRQRLASVEQPEGQPESGAIITT